MALMLRETALESSEQSQLISDNGLVTRQGKNNILSSKTTKMAELTIGQGGGGLTEEAKAQEIEDMKMNPQELGQLIVNLQDEIKIIKLQLENLPGYNIGEVPAHLLKLKIELEKTFESLEKKNEILVNSMSMNFGATQQDLPNFRLP